MICNPTRTPRAHVHTNAHTRVGTDTHKHMREREHKEGCGSAWTKKHGFERMVLMMIVPQPLCKQLDRYVRGGDRTATCEKKLQKWMHPSLKGLLPTDVLPLHSRPMGKFPTELRRLIDAFEIVCGLEDPDHLNADVKSEPVLSGAPNHLHHVLSR